MAASKKAGKAPVKKTAKPEKKKPVKIVADRKRPPLRKKSAKAAAPAAAAPSPARVRKPRAPKIAPQPEWRIVSIVVDRMTVFGLATDQRIYRWNTRTALWVLHKEGLSATQQ